MPFPTLIMGLIAKVRLKLPSGLTMVQRDYPIGAHTMTRSTTHIKGSKIGVHMIPQDRVEEVGGDTEEEIDRFTSAPETSTQPSSSTLAQGPDRLNHLLARVEQMYTMLDSRVQHTADQFAYVQGQFTTLSSQIDDLFVDRGSDSKSDQFQPFGHSSQKEGENFEGEHSLGLETLVSFKQFTFIFLAFITAGYFFTVSILCS